jgi:hypothetical protein
MRTKKKSKKTAITKVDPAEQEKVSVGADVLIEAHRLITGPRQETYSHPSHDYGRAAQIFEGMTGISLTQQQAVLFMVAVKLSRLRHNMENGVFHRDSLIDAVGYLGCLAMVHDDGVEYDEKNGWENYLDDYEWNK